FTTLPGNLSAAARSEMTYYILSRGEFNPFSTRAFLLESPSLVAAQFRWTDTQVQSFLILASILMGCFGLSMLARMLAPENGWALTLAIVPFYFLNLWSAERIIHLWIWLSYSVFPMFLYLGLRASDGKKAWHLAAYSLLFSVFGIIPHSFIYMAALHAVVTGRALLGGERLRDAAFLFFFPLLAYALINFPVLSLPIVTSGNYPAEVGRHQLDGLSQNANIQNILTFSNNWWPQVPESLIFGNPVFLLSSFGIFVICIAAALAAYPRMDGRQKGLAALLLAVLAGAIFVALGTNNPAIAWAVPFLAKMDLSVLVGPFREWGRIMVVAPVALSALAMAGAGSLRGRPGAAAAAAFAIIVAINIYGSPSWAYLKAYSPAHIPGEYHELSDMVDGERKVLWIYPEETESVRSASRYSWNRSKVVGSMLTEAIGSGYPNRKDTRPLLTPEAPAPLREALGLGYVIERRDFLGGRGFRKYEGWDCSGEFLRICGNGESPLFAIKSGKIYYGGDAEYLLPLMAFRHDFVPSNASGGPSAFVLGAMDPADAAARRIYVFEAEDFWGVDRKKVAVDERIEEGGLVKEAVMDGGSVIWTTARIPGGGAYMAAVRGSGNFTMRLGNMSLPVRTGESGFGYAGPVYLADGNATIAMAGTKGSSADSVWLYRSEGATLESMLSGGPPPARILSVTRIDPTRWKLDVEATAPFLLTHADAYRPGWEARVYREGELVESVKPQMIYGLVNGYWVEQTGPLEIELAYPEQESMEKKMVIAAAIFAALGFAGAYAFFKGLKWTE
ncbi:MAG: hypothetical protein AB1324_03900, partial [Candidatus Micrarchaeota archaeon]